MQAHHINLLEYLQFISIFEGFQTILDSFTFSLSTRTEQDPMSELMGHIQWYKKDPVPNFEPQSDAHLSSPPSPRHALWLPNAASSLLALQPPLVWPVCHGNNEAGARSCGSKEVGWRWQRKGRAWLGCSGRWATHISAVSLVQMRPEHKSRELPCDWAPYALSSLPLVP